MTVGQGELGGIARDRLLRVLETMPNAFLSVDGEFVITYVNAEGERLLRAARSELVGRNLFDAFPEAVGSTFDVKYHAALAADRPVTFEEFYGPLEGWFEIHAWPDRGCLNISFSNINERRNVQHEREAALSEAERVNARLSLLTDLTTELAGLSNESEIFERLVRAVVPAMADWSTVVVPEGEELVRVAAIHRDPTLDGLAKRLIGAYPHSFSGPSPGVVAYRSGQPLVMTRLAQEIVEDLDDSTASAAYGRTLLLLGDGPGLITPIRCRGEVAACMTLVRVEGEAFSQADIRVIDEVASRISTALEHARHVQTQRETASALQDAALPKTLPTFDRLQLAAGYRAATEGSQVGGDWYDAFALQGGRVALVVGDAAGHGLEAAAVMAQMRNALRAHLFASLSPAESLVGLSSLLAAHEPDAFATIICVVIDPVTGYVTWASAGHPAPILVSPDGTSAYLQGLPGPPVGWVDTEFECPIVEHQMVLRPADRLILFTDGLIERRTVNIDIGLTHLMILAEQTSGIDAPSACETILRDILSVSHEDDVCLLVAEITPAR